MKLVLTDDYLPGVLVDGGVVDLDTAVGDAVMAIPGLYRMQAVIADWSLLSEGIRVVADTGTARRDYRLRAPLPRPSKMIFAGSNYSEGLEEVYPQPLDMFTKQVSTIIDPTAEIVLPEQDAQLFFHEAELGVVIGKPSKNVGEAEALDHVFGYVCINDVSSFGLPGSVGGLRNKCFDTFCPVGPCIVTKDEIADPHALDIRCLVDGMLRQSYNSRDMLYRIPELIAFASGILTLEPGDILSCGTSHEGIGPIQQGERVRVEIDGIGAIENPVRDEFGRRWPAGPDHHFFEWVLRYKQTGKMEGEMFGARRIA